jgi:hypothetical protein
VANGKATAGRRAGLPESSADKPVEVSGTRFRTRVRLPPPPSLCRKDRKIRPKSLQVALLAELTPRPDRHLPQKRKAPASHPGSSCSYQAAPGGLRKNTQGGSGCSPAPRVGQRQPQAFKILSPATEAPLPESGRLPALKEAERTLVAPAPQGAGRSQESAGAGTWLRRDDGFESRSTLLRSISVRPLRSTSASAI